MSSIFQIGLNGALASEYALAVFGNNIRNADNPFYTHRDVTISERYAELLGNGVNSPQIKRIKISKIQLF